MPKMTERKDKVMKQIYGLAVKVQAIEPMPKFLNSDWSRNRKLTHYACSHSHSPYFHKVSLARYVLPAYIRNCRCVFGFLQERPAIFA